MGLFGNASKPTIVKLAPVPRRAEAAHQKGSLFEVALQEGHIKLVPSPKVGPSELAVPSPIKVGRMVAWSQMSLDMNTSHHNVITSQR